MEKNMFDQLVGGFSPPLWKIWISWDDDIPNWMEKIMFQTTKQYFMGVFQTYPLHLLMYASYSENGF